MRLRELSGWWRGPLQLVWLGCLAALLAGCPGREAQPPAERRPAKRPRPSTASERSRTEPADDEGGLPWRDDPDFHRARQAAGTPLLVSSFHAALPDPILYERHNIALAADYLKGAVVRPGEVFSLNARLGRRSLRRGFKAGPEYRGNRIARTVGGGVCKVASVMYNVVILADLPVVERHPHSMTVPYVPPGQDATISYGTQDFRFRNSSGSPLLIWARDTGGTLYVALYGAAKPPRVEWVHQVLKKSAQQITVHSWVVVTRAGGGTVRKDLGVSSYRPAPEGLS